MYHFSHDYNKNPHFPDSEGYLFVSGSLFPTHSPLTLVLSNKQIDIP